MWYNCTFPQNDSLNTNCCPSGNASSAGDNSLCLLDLGGATAFTDCLYKTGSVTAPKCYLQDWSNTKPDESAAYPQVAKGVSWFSMAFLGFLLLSGVTALQPPAENPVCTKFEPDARDTWNLDAVTPQLSISNAVMCDSPGHCKVRTGDPQRYYFEVQWVAVRPDGPVPVTGDYKSLDLPKDRRFAEKVWPPAVPDEFTFAPQHSGFMAVRMNAAIIPGTFKDCQNGTEYRGNVTVPEASGLYYYATVRSPQDPHGPSPDTESPPTWQDSHS